MKNIFQYIVLVGIVAMLGFSPPNKNKTSNAFVPKCDSITHKQGKKLFNSNCAPCHSLEKGNLIGPSLFEIEKKHKREWLINYISNDEKFSLVDKKTKQKREKQMFVDHQNFEEIIKREELILILDFIKEKKAH